LDRKTARGSREQEEVSKLGSALKMINMSSLSLDVSSFEPVLLFLCLLICVLLSGKAARKHFFPKLPPGPWGLPVVETICPKMCSKSRLKSAKSPLPVNVRRSKTSLLKLPGAPVLVTGNQHKMVLPYWATVPLHAVRI
ncbi:unnamed protein product, partial [Porites evermanni]